MKMKIKFYFKPENEMKDFSITGVTAIRYHTGKYDGKDDNFFSFDHTGGNVSVWVNDLSFIETAGLSSINDICVTQSTKIAEDGLLTVETAGPPQFLKELPSVYSRSLLRDTDGISQIERYEVIMMDTKSPGADILSKQVCLDGREELLLSMRSYYDGLFTQEDFPAGLDLDDFAGEMMLESRLNAQMNSFGEMSTSALKKIYLDIFSNGRIKSLPTEEYAADNFQYQALQLQEYLPDDECEL